MKKSQETFADFMHHLKKAEYQDLTSDQDTILKIKAERKKILKLINDNQTYQQTIQKLQTENKQLSKYKKYGDKYEKAKALLENASSKLEIKQKENSQIYFQLQKLMIQNRQQLKIKRMEIQLKINKDKIQETILEKDKFKKKNKDLENQCNQLKAQLISKQKELLQRITTMKQKQKVINKEPKKKTIQTIKQLQAHNKHLCQMVQLYNKIKIKECQLEGLRGSDMEQILTNNKNQIKSNILQLGRVQQQLEQQRNALLKQLEQKDRELYYSKQLNQQNVIIRKLSVEYDKSVTKNLEFQNQLSEYRKQNHQLKKNIAILMQHKKSQQQQQNYQSRSQKEQYMNPIQFR